MADVKVEDASNPVQELVEEAKADIFRSGLKQDLLAAYKKDKWFHRTTSHTDMEANLKKAVGEVDPEHEKRQLKRDFEKCCRRVERNEKFADYVKQLQELAAKITDSDYQHELVCERFQRELRPMDKDVVEFFGDDVKKGTELIEHHADILDRKKMFRKSAVSSHQVAVEEEMKAKIDSLANKVEALDARNRQEDENQLTQYQHLLSKIDLTA